MIETNEAAAMLLRKPSTLRRWARLGGPVIPVTIAGRYAWRRTDIERLLSGGPRPLVEPLEFVDKIGFSAADLDSALDFFKGKR